MVLKGVLLVATTRGVLRNFTKSTGKHLYQSLFSKNFIVVKTFFFATLLSCFWLFLYVKGTIKAPKMQRDLFWLCSN